MARSLLLLLLLAATSQPMPHPLDHILFGGHRGARQFQLLPLDTDFPGFSVTHNFSPYTEFMLPQPNRDDPSPPPPLPFQMQRMGGETFPGFTITQSADADQFQPITNPRDKNPTKPDSYLFPYLFPGASTFPGFTLVGGILPPAPISTGISAPISPEDIAFALSTHPWLIKDDLLKPIKEAMTLHSTNHHHEHFNISSPAPGRLTINFRKPEAVTQELLLHLEKSLKQFHKDEEEKEHQKETQTLLINDNDPSSSSATLDVKKDSLVDPSLPSIAQEVAAVVTEIEKPLKEKSKPSPASKPPRPEYGIQQTHKEELTNPNNGQPPRPIISNILNPLGSLSPLKWPSFTALIHRLFNERQQKKGGTTSSLRLEPDLEESLVTDCSGTEEVEELCSLTSNKEGCSGLCDRNGFNGGSCLPNTDRCICHVEQEEVNWRRPYGLLLKREKVSEGSCGQGCRDLGAYSGFCGGTGHCYCTVPWHDGSFAF